MARPCEYDDSVFTELMERLAAGETLRQICQSNPKYPSAATVRRWVIDNVGGCSDRYTRARESGIHEMIDETILISDDASRDTIRVMRGGEEIDAPDNEWIQRSRLRVDTRKWLASKIVPKIFGDKIQNELTGKDGTPLVITWTPSA